MTSEKKQLIITDIKSSLVSFALIAGPTIIIELMDLLAKSEQNIWTKLAALALGIALKLIQKWSVATKY